MQNFLLTLAYDGTNYCGFQVQPNGRSVAAAFQDALEAVLGSRPDIKGCSRTDAGVHALGFRLNRAKRALCRDGQQKRVTGLVVNERVAVPACCRRRLRQELYFCRRRGVEEHLRAVGLAEGREQCLRRLLGQVDFWLQAQPDSQEAAEYRRWLLDEMRDGR